MRESQTTWIPSPALLGCRCEKSGKLLCQWVLPISFCRNGDRILASGGIKLAEYMCLEGNRALSLQHMTKFCRACWWPKAAAGLRQEVETCPATWLEKGDTWQSSTPHMMTEVPLPSLCTKLHALPYNWNALSFPVWKTLSNLHSAPFSFFRVPLHLAHTFSVAYFLTRLQSSALRSTFPTGVWITTLQVPYSKPGHTI